MKIEYLENVCDILDSQRVPITASERISGIYPYYGANGIQDYVNDYIFDDELVLLAEDGGNFGSKTKPIAYRVSGKCWVNNHAHVLKPKSCINVDYLCYALMFYDTTGIVNGATRQKLTQASMRKMKIPIVDMDEQLKIVNKLNYLVHLKENIDNQTKKYDDLVKSQFIEMFGTSEYVWKYQTTKLENLASFKTGGTPNRKKMDQYIGTIPWITTISLGESYIDSSNAVNYISQKAIDESSTHLIPENSLMLGIRVGVGKCSINKHPICTNQDIVSLYSIKKEINPLFLKKVIDDCEKQFNDNKRGATIKGVTTGFVKNLDIPTPPIELQNQFADFVKHIDKLKFTLKQTLEKLENCYHSLMQEYFE